MILPADLLSPAGPVEETLFPGENAGDEPTKLTTRLQTYINRAYAKVGGIGFPYPDEAASAWALHLTFEAAYILACSRPATENSMVEIIGSEGYQKDQRDALRLLSQEYLMAYKSQVATLPSTTQPQGAQSRQITNHYEW